VYLKTEVKKFMKEEGGHAYRITQICFIKSRNPFSSVKKLEDSEKEQ